MANLRVAQQPVTHGINIVDFKKRAEEEAHARTLFYEDVDSEKFPGLQRSWTAAPYSLRQHYRAVAKRTNRITVSRGKQNRWYHALIGRLVGRFES